jgi:hypothetical protein
MSIQYVNRKGQTYFLHRGTTKTGKPRYFFSMKDEGNLAEAIPDGFEIYENANAQVFLRRIRPKIITDDEIAVVKQGMERYCKLKHYQIDVKKNVIIIFTANQDVDLLSELVSRAPAAKEMDAEKLLARIISYSPELQFELVDQKKRLFMTQRYCFLGSIDDWITIGVPDTLPKLVKKYVKHLGQESFYGLY